MRLRLVLDYETRAALARELLSARLLGIEMVEASLTRNYLAVLGELQSFAVRFVCFHKIIFSLLLSSNPWDLFCSFPILCNPQ